MFSLLPSCTSWPTSTLSPFCCLPPFCSLAHLINLETYFLLPTLSSLKRPSFSVTSTPFCRTIFLAGPHSTCQVNSVDTSSVTISPSTNHSLTAMEEEAPLVECSICKKQFKRKGIPTHQAACKRRKKAEEDEATFIAKRKSQKQSRWAVCGWMHMVLIKHLY